MRDARSAIIFLAVGTYRKFGCAINFKMVIGATFFTENSIGAVIRGVPVSIAFPALHGVNDLPYVFKLHVYDELRGSKYRHSVVDRHFNHPIAIWACGVYVVVLLINCVFETTVLLAKTCHESVRFGVVNIASRDF